jgi:hypothetical protein
MKGLLILLLLGLAAWQGYRHFSGTSVPAVMPTTAGDMHPASLDAADAEVLAVPFRCDGRVHCSQMNSRAEAEFFVRHCPGTRMDGDSDGDPCENDSRF